MGVDFCDFGYDGEMVILVILVILVWLVDCAFGCCYLVLYYILDCRGFALAGCGLRV